MDYQTFVLPNGIKLIHKQASSIVAHCGIIIDAGSRDEEENEHGMAHFIEHAIFKGTEKRKAYHIISRLEDVGGELDAFTSKEQTCIYATFLNNDYARTVELISDILFHSTYPATELKKEKDVIIDEINSYKDNPADLIYDDFEDLVFKGHPLGRNILGTPAKLKKFDKSHVLKFINNNYHTDRMVFCSVGNINFSKLVRLFEKYFGTAPANLRSKKRKAVKNYLPAFKTVKKHTFQSHCIIGNLAYNIMNSKRLDLVLLNNILGGQGMNSRFNMILREKYGYVYNVESMYSYYSDTGVFCICFGTDKDNLEKSIGLIYKEMKRVKNEKMGVLQLHRAKKQLIGQMAISSDNNANLMFTIGKSYLTFNKVDSLESVNKKIEEVTSSRLMEIANEIFDIDKISTLIYN